MTDLEKVLAGLKCEIEHGIDLRCKSECPYYGGESLGNCFEHLCADAYRLLTEQREKYTRLRDLTREQRRWLNRLVRKQERRRRIAMNKRQVIKNQLAIIENQEKTIAELERLNDLYRKDVKDYYNCIEGTAEGKSICDWCHDLNECQLKAKGKKGCKEWMLRSQPVQPVEETTETPATEETSHEG